jgi:penicillin-binding protein 1A
VFRIPGGIWRVKGGGIGAGTMAQCMVVSSNTCYANIMLDDRVGPELTIEMARKLGVVSTDLEPNPSIVLGANNATVQDMASVYGTFANDGVHVPPVLVTKIVGPDGSVIYQHAHRQERAMSSADVRQLAPALEGVISTGTGRSAGIGRPAGGKTGTAQNNSDAWFAGYTQQLSTAVWVGFAEPRPNRAGVRQLVQMTPPNTRITVYGGTYPAQIWSTFMRGALASVPPTPLLDPFTTPAPTTTLPEPDESFLEPLSSDGRIAVPDVAGLDAGTASARLRRAGLEVERVVVVSESLEPGYVMSQSPPANSSVAPGSTVWLEVTSLPATTTTTTTPPSTTTTTAPAPEPDD